MSIATAVRKKLSLKLSIAVAAALVLLTAGAGAVLTVRATEDLEAVMLAKARQLASLSAQQWGTVLDGAIDAGDLSVADAFDHNYVEIKGFEFGPASQKKYHSKFDGITDGRMQTLLDGILDESDGDYIYAIGIDTGGYVPTHDAIYTKPLTGNPEKDLGLNRTKRIYSNEVVSALLKSTAPALVQRYQRDLGDWVYDVSSPIFVKGKHWGAIRIGVSMERLAETKRRNALALALIFAVLIAVTVALVFVLIDRAMQPVVRLSAAAERIGLGEDLDQSLKTAAIDEVGQLSKNLDRLRISMKATLARLGE
jgi:HAMP domain-containing protein